MNSTSTLRTLLNSKFTSIFIIILSLFLIDCGGKKKKAAMIPWMGALMGGSPASADDAKAASVDPNGVPLPQNLGQATQEIPTSGNANINGNIKITGCVDGNGATVDCSLDNGLNITQIDVILINSNGQTIATTNPNTDGSYKFENLNLENDNYRVLYEKKEDHGANPGYTDFNFVNNPTVSINDIILDTIESTRKYYTEGQAVINGQVTTPGFIDQSGAVIVPAGGISGVEVELKKADGTAFVPPITAITDNNGNYTFNVPNLPNGNYTVVIKGSSTQDSSGRPFTDTSTNFTFNFSGNDPSTATVVTLSPTGSAWQPATSATASISDWGIKNVANSGTDLGGFTVTLKDQNGNVVATTTTDSNGKFSFSQTIPTGIYNVQVSKDGFLTSSTSFSFTANPTGGNTVVNQPGDINMVPRPSNITGTVAGPGNSPPRIEGASINFRPSTNQPPSSLLYLATSSDNRMSNLTSNWMREACLALSTCATACLSENFSPICIANNQGSGPWTYTTYANKVYEVKPDNTTVFFTAVAGKWEYYISAPGYESTAVANITLNGQDQSFPSITLTASTHRGRIEGQTVVYDTLSNGTTKNVYGGTAPGFTSNSGLPGMFVVMLGNNDSSNNPVAHITTTGAGGSYKFDGSSKVVNLPTATQLCSNSSMVFSAIGVNSALTENTNPKCSAVSDNLRVAYAISQFGTAQTLANATNVSGTNLASDSVTLENGNYNFKQGSYNIIVVDPLKHMAASSTRAEINTTTVPTYGGLLSISNNVLHLPRKEISGSISDAISTGNLSGATITLGINTSTTPGVITFSDGVYKDKDTIAVNIPRIDPTSGARADEKVPSVTTDASGNYSIKNVNPGTYVIKVEKSGYETSYFTITVPSNGGTTVVSNGTLVKSGNPGNLTGRVIIAGGANFTGSYNLELIHPDTGTRPTVPVNPTSLSSGSTNFTNAPFYNIFKINAGRWKVRFTAANHVSVEGIVNIQENATTNFDIVTMIPGSQAPSPISGKVINAFTNVAINSGLTISIRPGINNTNGSLALDGNNQPIQPVSSASDGSYVIPNVPAGNYTVQVSGPNFSTTYQTVISAGVNSANQNIFVSPTLATDEVRIVLSWGATPKDLDSHLEYGASPNQVVWNSRNQLSGNLTLDVDVVNGFGPETITLKGSVWSQPRRGYSIYNWSNEAPMSTSGAVVKIFKNTGLVRTYSAGSGNTNRWWQIFCLDGNRNLIDVGQPGCNSGDFFNRASY
jgi:hypothetical protein